MKNSLRKRAGEALKERLIEGGLFLSALFSVFITAAIVFVLAYEASGFFKEVSLKQFLMDTQWTPLFSNKHYGILPLACGTLLVTGIALLVALPLGLIVAVYLSEYASYRRKEALKPVLELLAAVPTVVYGYFALLFVTPAIQKLFPDVSTFNALSPGVIMGVMIVPYVSSLSEDAMRAVPMQIREGSYAMGATRFQTAFRVVIPSAMSGIASAFILGISRAVGETMVVAIAAGMMPNLTLNPAQPVQTLTAYIVQVSLGDVPHGTVEYRSIFAAGLTLFCMTLIFNLLGFWFRTRMREVY